MGLPNTGGAMGIALGPIGSAAVNAGMGIVNNLGQLAFGGAIQKQQLRGLDKSLKIQNKHALEMWEKTGYGAQMDQLERAGLNPGLMYGMGGGGGQTTGGSGAMPSGGGGQNIFDMSQIAQVRLLEAQAKKLEAETANIGKDTDVKGAQELQIKAETALKEIERDYQTRTFEDNVMIVKQQLELIGEQAQKLLDEGAVRTGYWKEFVQGERAKFAQTVIQNEAVKQGIEVDKQKIASMIKELELKERSTVVAEKGQLTNEGRLILDKYINDMPQSKRMTAEALSKLLGTIFGGLAIGR